MSNYLFWRSQSQSPTEAINFVDSSTLIDSTFTAIDNDYNHLISHSSNIEEMYQNQANNEVLTSSVCSQNPIRLSFVNTSRNGVSNRPVGRFSFNNRPLSSESSSSNSSLVGRYRTISGTNLHPCTADSNTAETKLSRLLRFASLRFDPACRIGSDSRTVDNRRNSQFSDLDEFVSLPLKIERDLSSQLNSNFSDRIYLPTHCNSTSRVRLLSNELCENDLDRTLSNLNNDEHFNVANGSENSVDQDSNLAIDNGSRSVDIVVPSISNMTSATKFPRRYGTNLNLRSFTNFSGHVISQTNSMEFGSDSNENYSNTSVSF